MAYSFQAYLDSIRSNWYQEDELLQRVVRHYAGHSMARAESELVSWGARVAGRLSELAEESAQPENRPRLRHIDANNHRIDDVVLPCSTREALGEAAGREHLGALHGDPFVFYAKVYLCDQNGEAGVLCSLACTDGLVRLLEALGDRAEHRDAVAKIRGSTPERIYHGAQFVTEIQGGSDVPANTVQAIADGDGAFRLHGQKWFCSNINADFFVVTARPPAAPAGPQGVALFLVPAYLDPASAPRNGYTIDRLKDKLGTRELATAEVTFNGALAYPVGAPDRGIANLVTHVLATSRFACTNAAVASLRQAERIVTAYSDFRSAFGQKLIAYPLVRQAVAKIRAARERTLAATFELIRLWQAPADSPEGADFRIMLSLCKSVITRQGTELLHEAMMVLGGNGIEERFSCLPRLYRDAVIQETWEGPHNVLLTQALRDLDRLQIDKAAFVRRVAGEARRDLVEELGRIFDALSDPDVTIRFAAFAERLVAAFGERALAEVRAH
jgi:alkylation response protein AidB-like acyl-CoA dehydrogenase